MEKQKDQKKNHSSKPNPEEGNSYLRFTSITFEILALNLIIIGGGYYLDQYVGSSFPWILMIFIFLSVIATIYYLLHRLNSWRNT